ncbi:hypothetical protein CCP2SC5_1270001 [Azospirillaceae bacterium]
MTDNGSAEKSGTNYVEAVLSASSDPALISAFSLIQQDVSALLQAANMLNDATSDTQLIEALDHNLRLWVAIRAVVSDDANTLPQEIKDNLRNLSQYVAAITLSAGKVPLDTTKVQSLAKINYHIAEGLLHGQQSKLIQERAYQIWEAEGRPCDRAQEHWLAAEREIREMLSLT